MSMKKNKLVLLYFSLGLNLSGYLSLPAQSEPLWGSDGPVLDHSRIKPTLAESTMTGLGQLVQEMLKTLAKLRLYRGDINSGSIPRIVNVVDPPHGAIESAELSISLSDYASSSSSWPQSMALPESFYIVLLRFDDIGKAKSVALQGMNHFFQTVEVGSKPVAINFQPSECQNQGYFVVCTSYQPSIAKVAYEQVFEQDTILPGLISLSRGAEVYRLNNGVFPKRIEDLTEAKGFYLTDETVSLLKQVSPDLKDWIFQADGKNGLLIRINTLGFDCKVGVGNQSDATNADKCLKTFLIAESEKYKPAVEFHLRQLLSPIMQEIKKTVLFF